MRQMKTEDLGDSSVNDDGVRMSETEIGKQLADAEKRLTRRDVCLACDQCIKRPAMPLACALIVNPDRDFQPCAAKLARMQAYAQARCPHPDPAQQTKWSAADLNFLGQPVHASTSVPAQSHVQPPARQRILRGTQPIGTTPIYTDRAKRK